MSHVLLWQEMNILQLKFAIILEDDALIEKNFTKKVTSRLQKLPTNWDVLYLGGFRFVFSTMDQLTTADCYNRKGDSVRNIGEGCPLFATSSSFE